MTADTQFANKSCVVAQWRPTRVRASLATAASLRTYLVDQTIASWNRIASWLRQIEALPQPPVQDGAHVEPHNGHSHGVTFTPV